MERLARVDLAAAPACPNCRQRVTDLDLDELAGGAEHQCLFCGHFMRVPETLLKRLIAQRDAALAAQAPLSFWQRLSGFLARMFGK
ncbi:MAG: hypothetical protein AB7S38_35405 [Vulcanimicrobiota bacterium]